ncbi:Uncharacterized protein dnm_039600 [Desulfonema magnum]|uniref:Uncharacterized protein n=1 Tax=Desulfonema magnum TaxID=45655 RepID=A0A975BM01_9BACT|nr:Uncharacterized protein dnm_039600 [Desulfonema magnum]
MPPLRGLDGLYALILQICRPYGAWMVYLSLFYKHAAPTGLGRFICAYSTNMPPLRGLDGLSVIILRRIRGDVCDDSFCWGFRAVLGKIIFKCFSIF